MSKTVDGRKCVQFVCAGVDATDSYGLTRVCGYRDLTANSPSSWLPALVPEQGTRRGQPAAPACQRPLGRVSSEGGPSCSVRPSVTALLKPFDLGVGTQGRTSRHQRGTMRSTSHTVDLDNVGSVGATVDGHGRV